MYSEIAQVYLGSAAYRVYKQMSDKRFGMHLKIGKFVCIKSSLQCMHHLYFFIEIPRFLEIPLIDFCETLRSRRHLTKEY